MIHTTETFAELRQMKLQRNGRPFQVNEKRISDSERKRMIYITLKNIAKVYFFEYFLSIFSCVPVLFALRFSLIYVFAIKKKVAIIYFT